MSEQETHRLADPGDSELDLLEAREIERLRQTLSPVFSTEAVDQMIAFLTKVVHRRISQSLEDLPGQFAESVVRTLVRPHPFHIEEVRLEDWTQATTGCVWLEPSQRLTLVFLARTRLALVYEPSFGEGKVVMEAQGDEAVAKFGFQSAARFVPMEIQVETQAGGALALLLQVHATPIPHGGEVLLRLDYSLFYREVPDVNRG
ncbi:MAG: hypothetical protein KC910_34490 [Candidatus Eremiobacteraeota bacterium]|nr:hypothetical protein [Candidatus Eremiobacteraeota bacterium]